MRKSIMDPAEAPEDPNGEAGAWLDLEMIARAEVSSEDDLFPVENALSGRITTGWRAAAPGPQVIRLVFDQPQTLRRIHLHVIERAAERSQEYALFAGLNTGSMREVVRQQFTFSPSGSTEEIESHAVDLRDIGVLELRLDPDRSHGSKSSVNYASLASLRLS